MFLFHSCAGTQSCMECSGLSGSCGLIPRRLSKATASSPMYVCRIWTRYGLFGRRDGRWSDVRFGPSISVLGFAHPSLPNFCQFRWSWPPHVRYPDHSVRHARHCMPSIDANSPFFLSCFPSPLPSSSLPLLTPVQQELLLMRVPRPLAVKSWTGETKSVEWEPKMNIKQAVRVACACLSVCLSVRASERVRACVHPTLRLRMQP